MMKRRDFNLTLMSSVAAIGLPRWQSQSALRVNGTRIVERLTALSQFGKNPQGGVSRVAYSEADRQGREYVIGLMRAAGLDAGVDAAGNIVGRRTGSDLTLKPLLMGSHIDSVPEGGNFDGDVGSLSAIEVVQTLSENKLTTRHPLEVIIFADEEGGTIGSHALSSDIPEKQLNLVSNSGKTIRDGTKFIGGDPDKLASVRRKRGDIHAYLELHIEQGGILDAEKLNIGVVEGIVGIRQWEVKIEVFANHAGTTPMNQRRDAMLAAAKFIEAVNQIVTSVPGRQVGTVGKLQAWPGAYNVIPGKVVLGLELRDLDAGKVGMLYQRIRDEAAQIGKSNGTTFDFTETNSIEPAPTNQRIRKLIDETAKSLGLSTKWMPSGAGHDAQEIARLGPVGMIFIPSVGGISHSPKEFSRPEDIANGANVLLHSLLKLDQTTLR
ncbi:MAG TPA: Zn-dependent hydrolase [Blastocatellia bacterium]|nr:Zn-dependent hydrolase [Blastocatellia bacterium]